MTLWKWATTDQQLHAGSCNDMFDGYYVCTSTCAVLLAALVAVGCSESASVLLAQTLRPVVLLLQSRSSPSH